MADSLKELLNFLSINSRLDLKAVSLEHLLGLTGTEDGIKTILALPEMLVCLHTLLFDENIPISKDASLCLVNISAIAEGALALVNVDLEKYTPPGQKTPDDIICTLNSFIFNEESYIADQCCMIFSNITRVPSMIEKVIDMFEESGRTFDELLCVFTKTEYNKKGAKLHYLGPVLSNLTQSPRVRKFILNKERYVVQRLLPFTEYKDSLVRRGGVVGTLKNCCFETDCHEWLLSDQVDILPSLLLPLAGNEDFDEEDNEKLPLELQYLPETKMREADPDIRIIVLEALSQLCAKQENREFVRSKNAYVILREYHKWEKDRTALLLCENLVNILIRTEEEIGESDLNEVDVPEDLTDKFEKLDKDYLEEC